MKKLILYPAVIALMGCLSACSLGAAPPEPTAVIIDPYQAASSTLTAMAPTIIPTTLPTLTSLPSPTPTSTVTLDSPTATPGLTLIAPTPTYRAVFFSTPGGAALPFGCLNAALVKTVTDISGLVIIPSQSFEVTWMFANTGTCFWPDTVTLKFIKGSNMHSSVNPIGVKIQPGKKTDATILLIAPSKEGVYTRTYQLSDKNGNVFGPQVSVTFKVYKLTPTPSP